jgi:amino acid adenylation domain-containing protein
MDATSGTDNIETSIFSRFQQQVATRPNSPAVITPTRTLSYRDLNTETRLVAGALHAAGVRKGDRVAIIMEQEACLISAMLGVLRCAAIYAPIDPKWSRERGGSVMDDARPTAVLADTVNVFRAQLLADSRHVKVINGDVLGFEAQSSTVCEPWADALADDLAYIYYTSGSTGPPKGVADTHRNIIHNVKRYTDNLGICASDRLTLVQTCGFSGAVSNVFGALLNGAAVIPVNVSRMTPKLTAEWFQQVGATIYHSVPTIFRSIATTNVRMPSLRVIRLEGDASNRLDIELFNTHFDSNCVLVNGLGATETGIVAQHVVRHGDVRAQGIVPVGQTTADMSVRIVDPQGRAVPPGESGEIEVTSKYLAHGYWNNPELTRKAFLDAGDGRRRYRTGDLGVLSLDGVLEHRGRTNTRIKMSGEWFDLALLETLLLAIPGVDGAVISVAANDNGVIQPQAWIVADNSVAKTDKLMATCRQALLHACGQRIDVAAVDALPLDPNGKVDRQRGHAQHRVSAPRTPTEQHVADVFSEILNLPNIGVESDFFELGGDSLAAVSASDAIDARLGTDCALGLLQHAPVVGELARLIDSGGTTETIVPLQTQGAQTPFFCVHAHMGHVFNLRVLATHFAPATPFYGIQAIGLSGRQTPLATISDMADAYVQAIRQHCPSGPYILGGYCFGSLVAVEMAQRLRKQGAVVEFVALIDPDIPGYNPSTWQTLEKLQTVLSRPIGQLIRRAIRRQHDVSTPPSASGDPTRIQEAIRLAHEQFQPGVGKETVHVFSPQPWTARAQAACEKWVGGDVIVTELNAPTQDLMRDPWARQLSDAISLQLETVRRLRS